MILTPDQIKLRLKKLSIRTDKYLGQHFLIDANVLQDTIAAAQTIIKPEDTIVEVGPGLGVLTQALLTLNHSVVTIEKDPVFAANLAQSLGNPSHLQALQGDVLQELDKEALGQDLPSWVVIANIPYAISSPLLRKLVYSGNPPHHILVLVQKELAERVIAKPGDRNRGLLTIQMEIMAESQILHLVSSAAFWPEPKVESSLLLLTRRNEPLVSPDFIPEVLGVVIAGFSAKRKQLQNSLAGGLGLPVDKVRQALQSANIDPTRRAETLTLAEWQQLTQILSNDV